MLNYKYPTNHKTFKVATSLEEKPRNPFKKLVMGACFIGGWLWKGYCDYASTTVYYDEFGGAHSVMFWF
jgi:hypothetical protein